ncbi:MAG TPA: TetR/AcrR family transcriptional regulator [Candidatus Dormibacteraeota bacterium]|nr:TetR/AcrR family transcriptional regulator [Candidatus Dormibacteraeota bacterium]
MTASLRDRPEGRSRDDMLEHAARLFAEKGYDAASMRDIAEEVAVRPSSLYHHFPSKERILFEICYGFQRDFNLEVLPELRADRSPEAAIRAAIRSEILFSNRRWSQVRVASRERRSLPRELQAPINALRRQYRDAMAATIERGCREGVFSVPDPKLAAMAVLDMISGLGHWFKPRDRSDLERMAARYGDAAVAMLRGWGAATAG